MTGKSRRGRREGVGRGQANWEASTSAALVDAPIGVKPTLEQVLPHRQWAIGTLAAFGEVTILAAVGGSGKSTLALALMIDAAVSSQRKMGVPIFGPPAPAAFICLEDNATELKRRFQAQMKQCGYTTSDIGGRITMFGKELFPGGLALTKGSASKRDVGELDSKGFALLEKCIVGAKARVVVLDSMMVLFPVGLNDQGVMTAALHRLRSMMERLGVACLLIHHEKKFSKDAAGSDAVFGSVAIVNQVRAVFQLEHPNKTQLEMWGYASDEAWRLFRPIGSKVNSTTPKGTPGWFELVSVDLGNAEPPIYAYGDNVQALKPFVEPTLAANAVPPTDIAVVVGTVASGVFRAAKNNPTAKQALEYAVRDEIATASGKTPGGLTPAERDEFDRRARRAIGKAIADGAIAKGVVKVPRRGNPNKTMPTTAWAPGRVPADEAGPDDPPPAGAE